jgi:hypothetical protein
MGVFAHEAVHNNKILTIPKKDKPLNIAHGDILSPKTRQIPKISRLVHHYVFCRTNAGHLGRFGRIKVLASNNGLDWYPQGTIQKDSSDVRNPSVYIFPDGLMLASAYKYNVYNNKNICSPAELSGPENLGLLLTPDPPLIKTYIPLQPRDVKNPSC